MSTVCLASWDFDPVCLNPELFCNTNFCFSPIVQDIKGLLCKILIYIYKFCWHFNVPSIIMFEFCISLIIKTIIKRKRIMDPFHLLDASQTSCKFLSGWSFESHSSTFLRMMHKEAQRAKIHVWQTEYFPLDLQQCDMQNSVIHVGMPGKPKCDWTAHAPPCEVGLVPLEAWQGVSLPPPPLPQHVFTPNDVGQRAAWSVNEFHGFFVWKDKQSRFSLRWHRCMNVS